MKLLINFVKQLKDEAFVNSFDNIYFKFKSCSLLDLTYGSTMGEIGGQDFRKWLCHNQDNKLMLIFNIFMQIIYIFAF